jgi:hypothetical protein
VITWNNKVAEQDIFISVEDIEIKCISVCGNRNYHKLNWLGDYLHLNWIINNLWAKWSYGGDKTNENIFLFIYKPRK